MARSKSALKVGTVLSVPVNQEHIDDSDPCNKDNCMLSRAIYPWLVRLFGEQNFKIKSTNHGAIFDVDGRRITVVFDTKTGNTIYGYDETFKECRSKTKARAKVKPFKARLIVEANVAVPTYPPMSEEKKAELAEWRRKHPRVRPEIYQPRSRGERRQLSL